MGNTPTLSGFTSNPCPGFAPGSNSKMNYVVTVGANRLTYTVDVSDPSLPSTPLVYRTDQAGTELHGWTDPVSGLGPERTRK